VHNMAVVKEHLDTTHKQRETPQGRLQKETAVQRTRETQLLRISRIHDHDAEREALVRKLR
jgi:hypothetical protein